MPTAGIKELKNHLSSYVNMTSIGEEDVLEKISPLIKEGLII